jgi:hypothetical protein
MQQILLYLAHGYTDYFSGHVTTPRVISVANKFSDAYGTDISRFTRARRKKAGQGNAVALFYPQYGTQNFQFHVLLSPGEHPARAAERLKNAADKRHRLTFDDGKYEAIRMPSAGGQVRWTWRLSPPSFEGYLRAVELAIRVRKSDQELIKIIAALNRMPGFHGVRGQIVALNRAINGEWRRTKSQDKCPYVSPGKRPYLRFIENKRIPMTVVVDRVAAGKPPFTKEEIYGQKINTGETDAGRKASNGADD